jgi:chemotaxis regulatin CheY-phosphate phosphatase CheZ
MSQHASPKGQYSGLDAFDAELVHELEPKLINLMQQSEALVSLMRGFFQKLDKSRSEEFKIIAGYIAKAKEEIRELRPHDLSHERIPTAGAELEAITRDTEEATHTIMNCAEAIMGFSSKDANYKSLVDDQVMQIFEACSFQDITGQRVSKVVNVLQQIEERVLKLAETLGVDDKEAVLTQREKRAKDLLLNGPAINGPETRQDTIDAMFAEFDEAPALKVQAPAVMPQAIPVAAAPIAAPIAAKSASPAATQATASATNNQDDIDSLFDTPDTPIDAPDMNKTNSQDDIDALFN